jgi:hypothetical protein
MKNKVAIIFDDSIHEEDIFHKIQKAVIKIQVKSILRKHNESSIICVNTPVEIREELKNCNIIFKEYGNSGQKNIFNEQSSLISQAAFFSQNWYKIRGKDVTLIEVTPDIKISMGRVLEHYLAKDIYPWLVLYEMLNAFIEAERPSEIFVIYKYSLFGVLLSLVQRKKIEVVMIAPYFWRKIERLFKLFALIPQNVKRISGTVVNLMKWKGRYKLGGSHGKNGVIVFVSTPNPTKILIPILKKFQAIGINFVTLNFDFDVRTNTKEILKKGNLAFVRMEKYGTLKDIYENIKYMMNIRTTLDEIHKNESMLYKNLDLQDILLDLVSYHLYSKPLMVGFARMSSRIIRMEQPKLIISANTKNWDGRLFTEIGNSCGINTLTIQEGLYEIPSFHHMFNSKKIALQGEEVKNDFLKSGVEEGRLVVTGAPVYDFIKDNARIRKEADSLKYLEKYGIDLKKGLIVFASQPCDKKLYKIEEKRRILVALKMAMANFPDCILVVKLHPYERYEELADSILEKDCDKNIVVMKDINIFDLMYICDLLITKWSTCALEAILLDKLVMTINLGAAPDPFPYADNNVALGVYREEDITPSLRRILYDRNTKEKLRENRSKFIENFAYRLDGNATDRILSLTQEMMTN